MNASDKFSFYLDIVFFEDKETGTFTAFFAQFPNASAEGRTKEEAKLLLHEIFPIMLEQEAEKYINSVPHEQYALKPTFEREKVFA